MLNQRWQQPQGIERKKGWPSLCQGGVALLSAEGFYLRPQKVYALTVRSQFGNKDKTKISKPKDQCSGVPKENLGR